MGFLTIPSINFALDKHSFGSSKEDIAVKETFHICINACLLLIKIVEIYLTDTDLLCTQDILLDVSSCHATLQRHTMRDEFRHECEINISIITKQK